ncbi:tetratricopeptide repeat protein [Pseudocnuella soli]|uniref:tetratricopeptide repeat protein n=1 Tax=Pseudocnuella soli TaxID=2502779 RepID=UPI00195B6A4E|nr:hypothetical protein [Pseudocnuella soli]
MKKQRQALHLYNAIHMKRAIKLLLNVAACIFFLSCKQQAGSPSAATIDALALKKGNLVACGPENQQLGFVAFPISGDVSENEAFNLGLKLLHSFEYDAAEQVFARIIYRQPQCAMAYWGVAMSNFHPLWAPPTEAEITKGAKAIAIAAALRRKTAKESDYINAIAAFYNNWENLDHKARCIKFETAMQQLHQRYPDDLEAAIFYALALNAAADPADKSLWRQKKAGALLQSLYAKAPNHPGVVHYLIHSYDSPDLARLALPAAKRYAALAPSSAHALHMPSHIFTRLGHWPESIASNLASVDAAQCYATTAGLKGHWDEELHGMDYLVYAHLQRGDNASARKQMNYLLAMKAVTPVNFKVTYAFAAIPSRYMLENKLWAQAAALEVPTGIFSWNEYPWQNAIIHFTRLLGLVHTGNRKGAEGELAVLDRLRQTLLQQKDAYKAGQVAIQIKTSEAWLYWQVGEMEKSLTSMRNAAEMEEATEKHPVTPGEVLPAKELLADMLMELKQWPQALEAYEASLATHPNRFNSVYGAAKAAEQSGDVPKARHYYQLLSNLCSGIATDREEIVVAKRFLQTHTAS